MNGLKTKWSQFTDRHPSAAKWVREGGLFVIVCNLVTVLKYFILQFLPYAFRGMAGIEFGWPGIPVTLFGVDFDWNIFGYAVKYEAGEVVVGGGLGYFCAYMIAMAIGEMINFPIQRNFVFRSKGSVTYQIAWYFVAFIIVNCIVNSVNCIWVAVAGLFMPDFVYNIGTTVLNGGISMVIFFVVNKIIFPEGEAKKQAV